MPAESRLGVVTGRPGFLLPTGQPLNDDGRATGVDLSDPEVKSLLDAGVIVEGREQIVLDEDTPDEQVAAATIDDLTAYVGADKQLAARVLTLENAKDKPRRSLIDKLDAVIAAQPTTPEEATP